MAYWNVNCHKNVHVVFLLVALLLLSLTNVQSRRLEAVDEHNTTPPKGTVKTIKGDDGDVVDCVDIYEQPAFNHPLLKDHKIRMDLYSTNQKSDSSQKLVQPWHNNGMCSEGTVPIRRRRLQETPIRGPHFEYAVARAIAADGTRLNGGYANISIWNPFVANSKDSSSSSLLVSLNPGSFLEAGWIVDFEVYEDFRTRLFMYTEINNSSCWDLDCSGFVQFSNTVALGSPIKSVSTIGAPTKFILQITIFRSEETGHWVLSVQGDIIGYWPASLFAGLPQGARWLRWGGAIFDSVGGAQHTETDMGNGLFPDPGTDINSGYVCDLAYIDGSFKPHYVAQSMLETAITNPLCYDLKFITDSDGHPCLLFGGSGRNLNCP